MSVARITIASLVAWVLASALPTVSPAQQIQLEPTSPVPALRATSEAKGGDQGALLAPKACVIEDIHCGDLEHGVLEAGDCEVGDGSVVDFWEFAGMSGTTVTVELNSTAFDAFLFLLDPTPAVVATDDDSGPGSNARIVHTLGSSGSWAIGANSFFPGETGNYSLRLTCSGAPAQPPAAPSNLTATALSSTEARLMWQDNSNNESSFRVEVRPAGGTFQDIGSVPANTTATNITNLQAGAAYSFRVRARNAGGDSAYSNVATVTLPSDGGGWITSSEYPDFRFRVTFSPPQGGTVMGVKELGCISEAVCVSGSLPGRSEVFLRIVGPKPNGYLWPTLVKFSTSQVDVWIEQISTGMMKHYVLAGATPGSDELQGLFDREGFLP